MKSLLKGLYRILPLKKQLFTLLRAVWKPSPRIYRHLYFKGDITVAIDEDHAFRMWHYGYQLENELFWEGLQGGWEKVSIGLWVKLCRRSNVIFDIGANTGVYALLAKSLNPQAKVYAFEPVQRVFEKLEANNRLNGYDIECVQAAVSDSNGTALIYDTGAEHVYSVTVNKNLNDPDRKVSPTEIKTVTLDHFAEANAVPRIDLLKIDVETHEPELLQGFAQTLRRDRPVMLIEILNDEVARAVEAQLEGLDYLYFNIDERAGLRRVEHLEKSDYYNFLVCSAEVARELGLPAEADSC